MGWDTSPSFNSSVQDCQYFSSLLSFGEELCRSTFSEAHTSEPPDCLKCCRCESAAHDVEGCNLELSFNETNGNFDESLLKLIRTSCAGSMGTEITVFMGATLRRHLTFLSQRNRKFLRSGIRHLRAVTK
jgi:hypothetical protein